MQNIKILIATIFQNSGDATRALELAKIIKNSEPQGYESEIIFLSRGSKFEQKALDLGFQIFKAKPAMKGIRYQDDFDTKFGELIGNTELATEILAAEIEAYNEIKLDLLIHGFWPIGSIAARMTIPKTKRIAFLPIPLVEGLLEHVSTFPDELAIAKLPTPVQKFIIKSLPRKIMLNNPALRHSHIKEAAKNLGWNKGPLNNIFDMLRTDLYLINDFPIFYQGQDFPKEIIFTGPIYSEVAAKEIIDPEINTILSPANKKLKIFCTLGSSGDKEPLLEIVKMFNEKEGLNWSGIILAPTSVCPVDEAKSVLKNKNVYITDKFVAAKEINKLVDLVICHGGQGTLQTAITSGTPIIGIATQAEQKLNLVHLEDFGIAIRIPRWQWKHNVLRKSVKKMLTEKSFAEKAKKLKEISERIKSKEIIANTIWDEIKALKI